MKLKKKPMTEEEYYEKWIMNEMLASRQNLTEAELNLYHETEDELDDYRILNSVEEECYPHIV